MFPLLTCLSKTGQCVLYLQINMSVMGIHTICGNATRIMRCKAVICRIVSSDCDRMNLVEPLYIQGMFFAERACSFAYLFFFSSALLHSPTPIYSRCPLQLQSSTVGCWAASLGQFSVNLWLKSTFEAVSHLCSEVESYLFSDRFFRTGLRKPRMVCLACGARTRQKVSLSLLLD